MSEPQGATPPRHAVATLAVTTARAAVERFALATGLDGAAYPFDTVPPTFPLSWLTAPAATASIERILGYDPFGRDAALVHLDQSVEYHRPLDLDQSYRVAMELVGPDANQLFRIVAEVADEAGRPVASLSGGFVRLRDGVAVA